MKIETARGKWNGLVENIFATNGRRRRRKKYAMNWAERSGHIWCDIVYALVVPLSISGTSECE